MSFMPEEEANSGPNKKSLFPCMKKISVVLLTFNKDSLISEINLL